MAAAYFIWSIAKTMEAMSGREKAIDLAVRARRKVRSEKLPCQILRWIAGLEDIG